MAKSYFKIYSIMPFVSDTSVTKEDNFDNNVLPDIIAYWGVGKEKRFPFQLWMFNEAFQQSENNDIVIVVKEIGEQNFNIKLAPYNAGDRNKKKYNDAHLFVVPFDVYHEIISVLGVNLSSIEEYAIAVRPYKAGNSLRVYIHVSNQFVLRSGEGIGPGGPASGIGIG